MHSQHSQPGPSAQAGCLGEVWLAVWLGGGRAKGSESGWLAALATASRSKRIEGGGCFAAQLSVGMKFSVVMDFCSKPRAKPRNTSNSRLSTGTRSTAAAVLSLSPSPHA
jgi:hypothetical protein